MSTVPHVHDPDGHLRCTNLAVRRLDRALTRHYDRFLAESGIRNTQYALLSAISRMGPIRPTDLAGWLQMDASTLTRNMRPLSSQGWVTIEHGESARSRLIVITAEGDAQRLRSSKAWKQAQRSLEQQLGGERITELHRLVDDTLAGLQ